MYEMATAIHLVKAAPDVPTYSSAAPIPQREVNTGADMVCQEVSDMDALCTLSMILIHFCTFYL